MQIKPKVELELLIFAVIILLAGGTIFYNQVENMDTVDAFYMSVSTLSTVGYGDFVPLTKTGKLFTSFYILLGVGVLLETLKIFTKTQVGKRRNFKKKKKQK